MRKLLIVLLFLCPLKAFSQGGRMNPGPALGPSGRALAGANVSLCQPLATTAASVTSNVAILTTATNPVTAGFIQGMQIVVAGFTGGDTYFNGGSIVNGQIVSGYTITSVTPTTITYSLVHGNASASSNGTALQEGNSINSCGGLSTVYTDATLGTPSATNPIVADGLGNFGAWAAPGNYWYQVYGTNITTTIYAVTIANSSQSLATALYCGATTGATQLCAQTLTRLPFVAWGDVLLNTAVTQSITGLPFTTATYSCSGSDLTTNTGIITFQTYANASVTIQENGGTNADHLRFVCFGN